MLFRYGPRSRRLPGVLQALLMLVLACAYASPAAAQSSDEPETYSFVFRATPLSAALERLVGTTRMDLYYDSPLVAGKRANCVAQEATPERVLRCILEDTGLDFIRLSSGTYVLVPASESIPNFGGLRGVVLDADTRQPLPNAHIMLAEATSATTANEAGRFAFSRLKPGRYRIVATHLGYRDGTATVTVPPGGDTEARITLESVPLLVEPVIVDGMIWRLPSSGLGRAEADGAELDELPGTGAAEVLGGLGTMLGVRMNDATADIHIQGGETGEHQLRLDGAPIFLPLSFASFVGPFSPFAVGRVTVHKAGFGAEQGSQISGIIDIAHDVTDARPQRLDVQVDPLTINSRASLRRSLRDGTEYTVMASGRASLWNLYAPSSLQRLLDAWSHPDPFLRVAFDRLAEGTVPFTKPQPVGTPSIGFSDLHAASRVRFGLLRSLHTSVYWGTSRFGTERRQEDLLAQAALGTPGSAQDAAPIFRDVFTWNTGAAQSTFESVLSPRALASARLRGSFYQVRHDYNVPDTLLQNPDDGNRIYEVGIEGKLDYVLGTRHQLELGAELVRTGSRFAFLGTHSLPIDHQAAGWRMAVFGQDEINVTPYLTIDLGNRVTLLAAHRRAYAEPRGAVRLDVADGPLGPWSLRLSSGLYRQFVSQFDVSNRSPGALLSSTRFWLVADSTVRLPNATHFAAEWLLRPSPAWQLRAEGYYKAQQNILAVDYTSGVGRAGSGADPQQGEFIKSSDGFVAGAGLNVERKLGPGRAAVRYEYSLAKRRVPAFFGGRLQRAPWDEPHRLELALDVVPIDGLTLLTRWRGVWGRRWGFRRAYYDYFGARYTLTDEDYETNVQRQVDHYEMDDPNEHRLPPIYQLDLSVGYTRALAEVMKLQLRVDVLNVFDTRNVAEWYLTYDPDVYYGDTDRSGLLLKADRPILPRVVSLALRMTW